jgi:hypothetical protein
VKVGDLVRVRRQRELSLHEHLRLGDQYVIGIAMVIDTEDGYSTIIDVQLSDGRWCSAALCDVEVLNESR